ncbi:MAG: preprotein translocase subunit Sec61beta [Candidatus Micrarchaeota archaeon]
MATERISTPTSSAGILRFYDTNSGGPALDPRGVVIGAVLFILVVKVLGYVL